ncbi:MAG: VWA domain-containing protein [Spirochaetes bacterium]|nr:VWA domain-containing protein [Spirochaetota bacterium]
MNTAGSLKSRFDQMRSSAAVCCIVFFLAAGTARAEIAVIPYKVNTPSADFPESTGRDYARLVALSSLLAKEKIEITSPREIDIDLERMKLDPEGQITGEDLDLLGRTRRIEYFLLGSLSRVKGRYRSESVLYSVRDGKVVARSREEADDLFALAGREVGEALSLFRNRERPRAPYGGGMDILFLVDLSYAMNRDWSAVKNAITGLTATLVDTRRMDTRIYLVPFADRIAHPAVSVSANSITSVRNELDRLKPAGGAGADSFARSLRYAIGTARWRPDADKLMIIISNSGFASRMAEQYGNRARKKGITIHTISLGSVPGEKSEVLDRLAQIGGGTHAHAAYHQKLYAPGGESVEVYMENGRFFTSRFPDAGWKRGLYQSGGPRGYYGKPKSFLQEIIYSDRKDAATPYTMGNAYTRNTMERIINSEPLESNVDLLLERLVKKARGRDRVRSDAGRALCTDGPVSFWVTAPDPDVMAYFIRAKREGAVVSLGVTVRKEAGSPYGISLMPVATGISADYIPESVMVRLGDLARRGEYYRTHGLSRPPVWFVRVKVDRTERSRGDEDIRGQ